MSFLVVARSSLDIVVMTRLHGGMFSVGTHGQRYFLVGWSGVVVVGGLVIAWVCVCETEQLVEQGRM
jgi:hypothetical protein